MKINIIYDSKHGNEQKIAEDLMDMIKEKGYEAHIYNVRKTKPDEIEEADLYIFGSSTNLMGLSANIKRMIKEASFSKLDAKYALFSTSKNGKRKAVEKMEQMLNERDLTKIGSNLNLRIEGKKGALEKDYLTKLERFLGKFAG